MEKLDIKTPCPMNEGDPHVLCDLEVCEEDVPHCLLCSRELKGDVFGTRMLMREAA